jgi:hypothetical protein
MMSVLIHWLEVHQLACPSKTFFGIDCPGCGIQSSFFELLKGHLLQSFKVFPALMPMLLMLTFLGFHLIFKLPKGALILKILFIFTTLIMIISYLLKFVSIKI